MNKKKNIEYFKNIKTIDWCTGCGNYSILIQFCNLLKILKIKKKNIILISGIGCSSRFPYYTNIFGIHSIHGRAFPIAFGLKICNPKLKIWVITGDGDSFSIGLNHLLHIIKKKININIIIFNNGIYALTKGQKSIINKKFNILGLMLSAGATFLARTLYNNILHLKNIFFLSTLHKGVTCIEILQNCPIFNNFKNKIKNKIIFLKNKKPLIFNKNKLGIQIKNNKLKIITFKKNIKNKIWIHNYNDIYKSYLLSLLNKFSICPLGIIYKKKIKKSRNKEKKKKIYKNIYEKILKKNFFY